MMSKVQHRMSDITRNLIANEDNVRNFYVPPETPDDDDMHMTRSKFSSLVTQALEQQIAIDNQTSAEAVKFAYTKGLKHGSTKQADPRKVYLWKWKRLIMGILSQPPVRVCYNRYLYKDLYCTQQRLPSW